jgi:hypothetical protein
MSTADGAAGAGHYQPGGYVTLTERIHILEAENAALREALEAVQYSERWTEGGREHRRCPECACPYLGTHRRDCVIRRALEAP